MEYYILENRIQYTGIQDTVYWNTGYSILEYRIQERRDKKTGTLGYRNLRIRIQDSKEKDKET